VGKEKAVAEVNWRQYFTDIKPVCPWAYRAMEQDKILTWQWSASQANTVISLFKYSNYEALVFTCPDKDSKWLEAKCDEQNESQTELEWLWSHPEHGGDSTPVPCLILQDAKNLDDLRNRTGYYDEDIAED